MLPYSNSLTLKTDTYRFFARRTRLTGTFWLPCFLFLIFLLIFISYLFLIGANISENYKLKNLRSKTLFSQENYQKLSIQISSIQSLAILEKFAKENNLVEAKDVSYIKLTQPVLVVK